MFNKYVVMPTTKEEFEANMSDYAHLGLHGAVGSMDATHIISDRISKSEAQLNTGFKSSHTARAFNVCVNHKRKILYSTKGFRARWNDKTIVRLDDFCMSIRNNDIGNDMEFELYYYESITKEIRKQKYSGVWLLVDNGYHKWSCTIPPMKDLQYLDQHVWSKWIESTRKDVECTFGIMKNRFRMVLPVVVVS